MFDAEWIDCLVSFIQNKSGNMNKAELAKAVEQEFGFTKSRSVYHNKKVAIRFSTSKSKSFSNTVLALSTLRLYDDKPFIVCLTTPMENFLYLANSTFLKKN